jgi:thiosulfate/3-mercaptopyruvate sulfurtransferase
VAPPSPDRPSPPSPATLPPVVDVAWLRAHPDVVVADVRSYLDGRSGRAGYEGGHLPGAVFVELDTVLAAPPTPAGGRHPLPSPDALASGLGALGIGDDAVVVAYDDTGGGTAARLVWMLRTLGRPAALLDGGLAAWDGALEPGVVTRPPVARTPIPWPVERFATADEVAAHGAGDAVAVVDARAAERYRGEVEPIDRTAGHVPGARNVPWGTLLDGAGRFLDPAGLRERFASVGIDAETPVVAMCGSGVSACVDLLALERAGLPPGRLFPGSWSAWCADPERPIAIGSEP